MVELALALLDIRGQAGGDVQRCQGVRRAQEHVRPRHSLRALSLSYLPGTREKQAFFSTSVTVKQEHTVG